MDGHGNMNYMWVLQIQIEIPTCIQLIVSKRIGICFFRLSLDNHKIVAQFFFPFVDYCLFMSCGKVHLQGLGVLLISV
jgi:hypothetical protein